MKTHLSFATADLGKSIAYYAALLDAEPAKNISDYALFVTEEPGLELALNPSRSVSPSNDAHFGIGVPSVDFVERALSRLQAAGYGVEVEREETCCYASQTKVWSTDPDGRRWEVYAVHAEMEADRPGALRDPVTLSPSNGDGQNGRLRSQRACCGAI